MFNNLFLAEKASDAAGGNVVLMIVMYVIILGGMLYLFALKPQKKEEAKRKALMEELKVGSYICTSSGFYGQVIGLEDEVAIVEFGNNKNCRIPMKKSHIVSVENEDE